MANSGASGPKAGEVLAALLGGATQREAGAAAGVSHRTVQRWLADPGFQRRLQEAQEDAIKQVRRRVTVNALRAAEALAQLAETGDKDDAVKVAAARATLAAFVQLQPRTLTADVEVSTRRYEIVGVDPAVYR